MIGSGVLSLAWAIAQLGWIAGPAVMLLFSFVTYYTSSLLTDCYRTGDPLSGKRNYTYTDAVRSILGTLFFPLPNFGNNVNKGTEMFHFLRLRWIQSEGMRIDSVS